MKLVKRTRRGFLWGGLAAIAAGGTWLGTCQSCGGRWIRQMIQDARREVRPAPHRLDWTQWRDNAVTVGWIGHATLLINFYGAWILTDPAFGRRIGVGFDCLTIGPKRYIEPALSIDELPKLDLLLLSHAHMDHMDLPSLRALRNGPRVVTADRTADILKAAKIHSPDEMRWGQVLRIRTGAGDMELEAFQVNHWGQRWPSDPERGYNGYLIRREDKTVLFGGDTAWYPPIKELRRKKLYAAAIFPIAAYDPWIWNHCTPEQAVEMARMAGAAKIIPVHHETFKLSDEPMEEPLERFRVAMEAEPERMALGEVGQATEV